MADTAGDSGSGPAVPAYEYPYRPQSMQDPGSSSIASYSIGYPDIPTVPGKLAVSVSRPTEKTSPPGTSVSHQSGAENTEKLATDTGGVGEEGSVKKKPKLTRIHQACIPCGSKKQKCSGETPCAPCKTANIECIYKESKKRGPPKGTKRVRKAEATTKLATQPVQEMIKQEIQAGEQAQADRMNKQEHERSNSISFSHSQPTSTTSAVGPDPLAILENTVPSAESHTHGHTAPLSALPHILHQSSYSSASSVGAPPAGQGNTASQPSAHESSIHHSDPRSAFDASIFPDPRPTSSSLLDPTLRESVPYPQYTSHFQAPSYPYKSAEALQHYQQTHTQQLPLASPHQHDERALPSPQLTFGTASTPSTVNHPTPNLSHLNHQGRIHNPDTSMREPGEAAESRLLLFDAAASYGRIGHSKATDSITEHYRGGTSGLPSLHAQRRKSDDYGSGGSLLGTKRGRSDSAQDQWRMATRSPALPLSRAAKQEVDVMMPYGLARDVAPGVDEQFTLPPIRLPNTMVGNQNSGLHIPKALFDRLINYYFAISHHSCPIIYKPDVDMANIEHQLPPVLLDGMCCLAARFLENEDLAAFFPHLRGVGAEKLRSAREQIEQHYYDRARKAIQDDDYRSDITTVQALLLLSKRDNGSGRMLHCWQLVGSATRMVIDLGLHRGAALMSQGKGTSYAETETRRRVFWQTYIMDKHAAASLGRPVFLREEDIDVKFPSELATDEFDRWVGNYPFRRHGSPPPENRAISTHNAFARLSIILQSIINDVYSTRARKNHFELSQASGEYQYYVVLRSLYSQLCAWKTDLPAHLQWTPGGEAAPPLPHQLLLHAFHSTCLLLVFRPVVPVSIQETFPSKHHMPRPHDVCTKAADTIMQIMDVYERSYGLQKVPSSTAVYYIFTAATIYVGNSSSSNQKVANEATGNLDKCIRLLDQLSDAVCAASQHRQILLDITSLGSTKLRSRDDAEDLLSSRVPEQRAQAIKSSSPLRSPLPLSDPALPANGAGNHPTQEPNSLGNMQPQQQQDRHQRLLGLSAQQNIAPPTNIFALQQQQQQQQKTPQLHISQLPGTIQGNGQASVPDWTDIEKIRQENQHRAMQPLLPSVPSLDIFGMPSGASGTFLPTAQTSIQTDTANSFAPFDFASLSNSSQADLAFWREMPIGCADLSDWDSFTNSYAHQLLTGIPTLGNYAPSTTNSS